MAKATFNDLDQLNAVMKLGDGIPFALEILESECASPSELFPHEGKERVMIGICKRLADNCLQKEPDMELLKEAAIQIDICRQTYHEQERCQKYATLAVIFITQRISQKIDQVFKSNKCEKNNYQMAPESEKEIDAILAEIKSGTVAPETPYLRFRNKWKARRTPGHYGVDMMGVPEVWYKSLDEIMDFIVAFDDSFSIHQIKLKYGGCRWYVGSTVFLLPFVEDKIESVLHDDKLIY